MKRSHKKGLVALDGGDHSAEALEVGPKRKDYSSEDKAMDKKQSKDGMPSLQNDLNQHEKFPTYTQPDPFLYSNSNWRYGNPMPRPESPINNDPSKSILGTMCSFDTERPDSKKSGLPHFSQNHQPSSYPSSGSYNNFANFYHEPRPVAQASSTSSFHLPGTVNSSQVLNSQPVYGSNLRHEDQRNIFGGNVSSQGEMNNRPNQSKKEETDDQEEGDDYFDEILRLG